MNLTPFPLPLIQSINERKSSIEYQQNAQNMKQFK